MVLEIRKLRSPGSLFSAFPHLSVGASRQLLASEVGKQSVWTSMLAVIGVGEESEGLKAESEEVWPEYRMRLLLSGTPPDEVGILS